MKVAGIMSMVAACATSALVVGCTAEDFDKVMTGKTAKERDAETAKENAIAKKEQAIQKYEEAKSKQKEVQKEKDALELTEFLGVKLGSEYPIPKDAKPSSQTYVYSVPFVPKKQLPGLDEYELFLTPISHKVFTIRAGRKVDGVKPVDFPEGLQIVKALEMRYGRSMKFHFRGFYTMDFDGQRISFDVSPCAQVTEDYGAPMVCFGVAPNLSTKRLWVTDSALSRLADEEGNTQRKAQKEAKESAVKKDAEKLKDIF